VSQSLTVNLDDVAHTLWTEGIPSQPKANNITCQHCNRTFASVPFLKNHMDQMHSHLKPVDQLLKNRNENHLQHGKEDRSGGINGVGIQLASDKDFADGFEVGPGQHASSLKHDCRLCGKRFASKGYTKRHTDLVHLRNKTFSCNFCGQSFSANHVLKRHVSSVHLKQKKFGCEKCGQTFSENQSLKRHVNSVHLKERNFGCDQCGKSFSETHVLKRHVMSVHLKQRNHRCDMCGQAFSEKHVLKRHYVGVHGSDGGRGKLKVKSEVESADHSLHS
jgi:KRAB domain-containing zinc finger protein